jgi:hypothetical protein
MTSTELSHPADEFRVALNTLSSIAEKDYGISFEDLLKDSDQRRRSQRMRQITGVAMKRDFSRLVPGRSGQVPHQWKIDPVALAARPDSDWTFKILEVYPDRTPQETGKDVALRLKRETLLGRAFVKSLHEYICIDGETRKTVKDIITNIGLQELAELASPEGLIKVGAGSLFAYLVTIMPFLPSGGIAVATIVVCVVGLKSICRESGEAPKFGTR